jgi:hypothetical protein
MKVDLTLRLEDPANPFRLSASEQTMTAEDWAWKFLRLNPKYRHDYELAKQEDLSDAWRHASVQHYLDQSAGKITAEYLHALDSRLFVNDKGILDSQTVWPRYVAETLAQHFHRTKQSPVALDSIRFRELDAPRDYGINEWLDPALTSLPKSSSDLSWFHWKLDPIWETAHQNFIPVDFLVSNGAVENKHVDVVRIRALNDMLPVMRVSGTRPAPVETGTWFAFVISAFTYLKPQLHKVKEIAVLYQQALQHHEGLTVNQGNPPPGFEPLIWNWDRRVRPLGKIDTAMDDLLHSHPTQRQWFTVLFDVRFDLGIQFKEIEKRLHTLQEQFPEYAEFKLRHRAGNLMQEDFWLKRYAVLAEMLTTASSSGQFPTAMEIERNLFDGGSPDWAEFWTYQLGVPPRGQQNPEARIDMIQKSAAEARHMVEQAYEFLIGRSQKSL